MDIMDWHYDDLDRAVTPCEADRAKLHVPEFPTLPDGTQLGAMRLTVDPERFIYGDHEATGWLQQRLWAGMAAFAAIRQAVEWSTTHGAEPMVAISQLKRFLETHDEPR